MNRTKKHFALKLMFAFSLFAVGLNSTSCALTPRKRPPQVAQPDVKNQLQKIEIKLAAGGQKQALAGLQDIVKRYPETDVADDAYIMMGQIYSQMRDFESSYAAYMSVVNSEIFSPREADALWGAAQALTRLGRFDEALSLTDQGLRFNELNSSMKLELYKLRFSLLSQLGDRLDALRAVIFLAENEPDKNLKNQYRERALGFVESRLTDQELLKVADDKNFGLVRGQALFRVGSNFFEQRDFGRAKDYLEKVEKVLPETEWAERASQLIAQIDARRRVNPTTIGAVLPLSGRHGYVAQKTLQGLQLGLGIFGADRNGRSEFRLAVIDSEGNPDAARRAVERLVTEDHVIAVVGSLLSRTATAVAAKANELGVPSLALSQKSGLTDIGDYVFRNSLTSEMQVRQLVKVAMEERNMKRFAILFPNDPYGVEYANLFWDEVLARGGQITGAQPYDTKETDFSGPVSRLVGTYYLEDRQHEYRLLLTEWYKKRKTITGRVQPPNDLLPPVVDFDGIFIPDSTKAIGQIAPMLAYHNIRNVKLLGTNLWNSDTLVQRGQKHVEGSLFVDSFWSSEESFRRSSFFKDFKAVFGEDPNIFASQGYDAGLILRQLISSGERSRVGLKARLSDVQSFPGSIGRLYMSPRRELNRPLVTLTVEDGKIAQSRDIKTTVK